MVSLHWTCHLFWLGSSRALYTDEVNKVSLFYPSQDKSHLEQSNLHKIQRHVHLNHFAFILNCLAFLSILMDFLLLGTINKLRLDHSPDWYCGEAIPLAGCPSFPSGFAHRVRLFSHFFTELCSLRRWSTHATALGTFTFSRRSLKPNAGLAVAIYQIIVFTLN